jgi:predicted Zn-dependent peptidase
MNSYEFQGTGIVMTFLSCVPEETEANLDRIERILRTVEQDGINEDELTRAKSKVCSSIVLQAERPAYRMFSVGGDWIQRREYKTVRETVEAYRAVTREQIRDLLDKYPPTVHTTVTVGPLERLATT